jgi:transaldolase
MIRSICDTSIPRRARNFISLSNSIRSSPFCLFSLRHKRTISINSNNSSTHPSLLTQLKSRSRVSADTLSLPTVTELGPFDDATSNQAIAYLELDHTEHSNLLKESARMALSLEKDFKNTNLPELATEIATLSLALRLAPYIKNVLHVQINPFFAYDTKSIIANAERLRKLSGLLKPDFDQERLCMKIPSTWEGFMACEQLERRGVKTLATTLFAPVQAQLAGNVGCSYIAPYVHRLKVHFEQG